MCKYHFRFDKCRNVVKNAELIFMDDDYRAKMNRILASDPEAKKRLDARAMFLDSLNQNSISVIPAGKSKPHFTNKNLKEVKKSPKKV